MDPSYPVRKPLRLSYYDYSTPGAYFITFCTHNKVHTLSQILPPVDIHTLPRLTQWGKILDAVIRNIPEHLSVTVDRYVIMPNHVHMIVFIPGDDPSRAVLEPPLRTRSLLSNFVGYIKMNSSKAIRQLHGNIPVWQRGYHDHVIRGQQDYLALSEYILENPLRWELDEYR